MQYLPNPPPLVGGPSPFFMGGQRSSTADKTPREQQEMERYFAEMNLQQMLVKAVEKLLVARPENPVEFLVGYMLETYPEQAGKYRTSPALYNNQRASPIASPPSSTSSPQQRAGQQQSFPSTPLTRVADLANLNNHSFLDHSMISMADDDDDDDDFVDLSEVMDKPRMPSPKKSARKPAPQQSMMPQGGAGGKGAIIRNARRGSISAAPVTEEERTAAPVVYPKSDAEKKHLVDLLSHYWVTASLSAEQKQKVVDAMELVVFHAGDVIVQQGDEKADHYYVIKSGRCAIVEGDSVKTRDDIGEGEGFGELALLYNQPQVSSVVASSDTVEVYRLDRTTFRVIVVRSAMDKRERHIDFLGRVPLLADLDDSKRRALADALQSRTFTRPGEHVVTQGEKGAEFFIIERGRAEVVHDGEVVDVLKEGDYFGEIALMGNSGVRAATVRVPEKGDKGGGMGLTVLSIRREVFIRVLGGSVTELLKRKMGAYRRTPAKPKGSKTLRPVSE